MDKSTFLNKVIQKSEASMDTEHKDYIYISSTWRENGMEMHLHKSNTNKSFKAKINAEQLNQSAKELDIPFDEFYAECKEALTANISLPPFEYELIEDELQFRLIKKETFEITYLELPLSITKNISSLLDRAVELVETLRETKEENLNVAKKDDSTTKELVQELRNCVKEKEQMEKNLLTKFLLLLNSKKEKISELKAQLESPSNDKPKRKTDNTKSSPPNNNTYDDENRNSDDDFYALTQKPDEDIVMATSSTSSTRPKRGKARDTQNES